jgi:hypothetical protein
MPGRRRVDTRHNRMAELLNTDPELIRRRQEGDRYLLPAAARKAILENPKRSELTRDGEPDENVVKRMVRTMPKFALDDPEVGFDVGFLLP